ncbi:15316_t:CDS:2 [Entrophospora sp. SA101]|nr:15316_t:CDS:2 [Entrophospora sp. SA101]
MLETLENTTSRIGATTFSTYSISVSFLQQYLTSEFEIGMHTFFGEEWDDLKTKVYGQLNLTPLHFEGIILETIKAIEEVKDSLSLEEIISKSISLNLFLHLDVHYI